MPKAKKTNGANGVGHNENGGLSDDDLSALTVHHQVKITADQRKLDALLVDVSSQRKVVNASFKRMTADTTFTRKDFQTDVLDKLNMSDATFLASERRRVRMQRLAGLRPGEQGELDFAAPAPDTVDDEIEAEANGYRAGRRADDPIPPREVAPIMHTAWMRGYHEGVAYNGRMLERAGSVIAARAAKKPELKAGTDPDETPPEEGADLEPEVIAKKARKLKAAGWTEPTADEAKFPEPVH